MNGDSRNYAHYETNFIVKGTLRKKLHQNWWTRSWTIHRESLIGLTGQSVN